MSIHEWVEAFLAKPAKLLVVDDSPVISEVIKAALHEYGCEYTCAYDGESAIEQVRAAKFDLVFLDLVLPGVSGVEVLREIKRTAPDTPVVFMTGYPDHHSMDEVFSLGIVSFMRKPFDFTPAHIKEAFRVFKVRGFPPSSIFSHRPLEAVTTS